MTGLLEAEITRINTNVNPVIMRQLNMAHQIHTTRGLVLRSRDYGESSRIFWVFTRDLGLVRALARSVREPRSKIRGNVEDLALLDLSLVEGRELWRIVGTGDISRGAGVLGSRTKMQSLARAVALLLRFIQGEDPHPELFDDLEAALGRLEELSEEELEDFELDLFIRILSKLGHIGGGMELKDYSSKREASQAIKQAFEESHL